MGRPKLAITGADSTRIVVRDLDECEKVKAADRALRILEFLDEVARPARIKDIADTLDIPSSSAASILKSLAGMGYLTYDRDSWGYAPGLKITMMGHWVDHRFHRPGPVVELLRELQRGTGHVAFLAERRGAMMQIIHLEQGGANMVHFASGNRWPALTNMSGLAAVAALDDVTIGGLVRAHNAHPQNRWSMVDAAQVAAQVASIRCNGFGTAHGTQYGDLSVYSAPLPVMLNEGPAVLGLIARPDDFLSGEAYHAMLTGLLDKYGAEIAAVAPQAATGA